MDDIESQYRPNCFKGFLAGYTAKWREECHEKGLDKKSGIMFYCVHAYDAVTDEIALKAHEYCKIEK